MANFFSKIFGKAKSPGQDTKQPAQLTPNLIAKFEALKRPCVAIRTKAVNMDDLEIGESRFGGVPDTPEGFSWPGYKGVPFPFIAQVNFKDIASFDEEGLLPREGHLLVFYEGGTECWGFRPDDNKYWKIQYVTSGTRLTRQSPPANLPEWPTIRPGKLMFSKGISYADAWDFAANHLTNDERFLYADYTDQLKLPVPAHQLLGHSRNVQNDMKLECQLTSNGLDCGGDGYNDPRREGLEPGAADWMLFLQFDTDDDIGVMWGDVGTIYLWIRKQDLAARNFEKARICFQCS